MTRQAARPVLLTVAEAARQLSASPRQVYGWLYTGTLAPVRLPSRSPRGKGPVRIEQAEIDRFIAACRQPAT